MFCHLDHLSVCLRVCLSECPLDCGKTADWIGMPFGVVGRLHGPKMRQVGPKRSGDRPSGRAIFGGEHAGCPIVTNGKFVA